MPPQDVRIDNVQPWKLYYDGGCNLCHASQLKAVQWAERSGQPLETEFLQSSEAFEKGYGDAMVLEANGQVYKASEAWLVLVRLAPIPTRWLSILGPPLSPASS